MRKSRLLLIILIIPIAVAPAAAACTRDGGAEAVEPGPTAQPPTQDPEDDAGLEPVGEGAAYALTGGDVRATLTIEGNAGTLQLENGTGRELAPPSIYALHFRDGRRVAGRIDGGGPVPDGETVVLDVSFPEGFGPGQVGLVALVIGEADYGAFTPQRG